MEGGDYLVWPFNIFVVVVTLGNKMNGVGEKKRLLVLMSTINTQKGVYMVGARWKKFPLPFSPPSCYAHFQRRIISRWTEKQTGRKSNWLSLTSPSFVSFVVSSCWKFNRLPSNRRRRAIGREFRCVCVKFRCARLGLKTTEAATHQFRCCCRLLLFNKNFSFLLKN